MENPLGLAVSLSLLRHEPLGGLHFLWGVIRNTDNLFFGLQAPGEMFRWSAEPF